MSFYKSHNGKPIDGSDKNTFSEGDFTAIPDDTFARASIRKFELQEVQNKRTGSMERRYQIEWVLVDGDFKNRRIWQNIKAFDSDADQHAKALNMMVRLFGICDFKPTHDMAPSTADLLPMIGKLAGVRIRAKDFEGNGELRNWVSEVHKLGSDFITRTGFTHPVAKPISTSQQLTDNNALYGTSATGATHLTEHMQNNPGLYAGTPKEFDDDIPF